MLGFSIRLPRLEQSIIFEQRLDVLTLRGHSFSDIRPLDIEIEGDIHDDLEQSDENCEKGNMCWGCKRLLD